jgi:hypothetical protein
LIDLNPAFSNIDAPFLVAFLGVILTDFFCQPTRLAEDDDD